MTSVPGLNVVCVNGPVPSVSVTPKSSPSSSRLRRFTGMEFSVASVSGNAVNGFFMVTMTVVGSSPALASATDGQKIAFWPFFGCVAEDVEVLGHHRGVERRARSGT